MEKIKNLSVRKTILLYLTISLICSFILSAVIVKNASRRQEQIWWKYVDQDAFVEAMNGERGQDGSSLYYQVEIPRPYDFEMSESDHRMSEVYDFLQTYTVLLLSVASSGISIFLFYKHKLKRPIEELNRASKRIAENDLDFHVSYENQDEMGSLCQEFEKMREQLSQNNQEMWRMIEEEQALRAAISHDIRSPLSVLSGYQEMLMDYLPGRTIDMEKAMEMLSECSRQTKRMDLFVETMRKLSSLKQRTLLSGEITAEQMKADIQAELVILQKNENKQVICHIQDGKQDNIGGHVPEESPTFLGDKEIILEVVENLLVNAFRYAKEKIELEVLVTCKELKISVKDDGAGFDEDEETVTQAFYQQNVKDSLKHAGMGMYISRLYCEKHGGSLRIENRKTGGAAVTATFRGL